MTIQPQNTLRTSAQTVKNENTRGANTALRVGGLFEDMVDSTWMASGTTTVINPIISGNTTFDGNVILSALITGSSDQVLIRNTSTGAIEFVSKATIGSGAYWKTTGTTIVTNSTISGNTSFDGDIVISGITSGSISNDVLVRNLSTGVVETRTIASLGDDNDFLTGATFNTSDGIITLNVKNQSDVTVDIDNRYSLTGHTHIKSDITDFSEDDYWKTAGTSTLTSTTTIDANQNTLTIDNSDGFFDQTRFIIEPISVRLEGLVPGSSFPSTVLNVSGSFIGLIAQDSITGTDNFSLTVDNDSVAILASGVADSFEFNQGVFTILAGSSDMAYITTTSQNVNASLWISSLGTGDIVLRAGSLQVMTIGSTSASAVSMLSGYKFVANPDNTNAGFNVGTNTTDPTTGVTGDIYYDSTNDQFKGRTDTTWIDLGLGINHDILSSAHSDTVPASVVRGDVMVGNATPAWNRIPISGSGTFLRSDGIDPSWSAIQASDLPTSTYWNLTGTSTITGAAVIEHNNNSVFFDMGDISTNGGFQIEADLSTDLNSNLFRFKTETADTLAQGRVDIYMGSNAGNPSTTLAFGNIMIGNNVAPIFDTTNSGGGYNTFIGNQIATLWGTGDQGTFNTFIGYGVANSGTRSINSSVGIGQSVLFNVSGSSVLAQMTAVGYEVLFGSTITSNQAFFDGQTWIGKGVGKGAAITDGIGTVVIGRQAAQDATLIEDYEVIIGDSTAQFASLGRGNIAIGPDAMKSATGGSAGNAGVGSNQFNVAIGAHTMEGGTGEKSTFIGSESGSDGVSGSLNTGIGAHTINRVIGDHNTGVGAFAGYMASNDITGFGNTFIGASTGLDTSTTTVDQVMVIGNPTAASSTTGYRPSAITGNIYIGSVNNIILETDYDGTGTTFSFSGDTFITNKLAINATPVEGVSDDDVLVWDSTDKKINKVTQKSIRSNEWESLLDSGATSTNKLLISGGSRVKLTNDGVRNIIQSDTGNTFYWNTSTNKIEPKQLNDFIMIRLELIAESINAASNYFDLEFDVSGGTSPVIWMETANLIKGAGVSQSFNFLIHVYVGSDFLTNGGEIYVTPSNDINVWDIGITTNKVFTA